MRKAIMGALAISALCASQSLAATIDFRKQIWDPNGAGTKTVGQVTAIANPDGSTLFWTTDDGFGVDSGLFDREDDEINNNESLTVTFASPFTLSGFSITDLFHEGPNGGVNEVGQFRIDGGSWVNFASNGDANGLLAVSFAATLVNKLEFRALTTGAGAAGRNDFSVATLEAAPAVPEPTSLLLLGSGLVGIASRVRRRKRA